MVSRRERKIIIIRTAEKDLIRLGQEGSDFEGLSYTAKTPQNTKTNTHNKHNGIKICIAHGWMHGSMLAE